MIPTQLLLSPAVGRSGSIERLDSALDELLGKDAIIEKLAQGFDWSEGPVWMPAATLLRCSAETIFKWDQRSGISIFVSAERLPGTPRARRTWLEWIDAR